MLAIELLSAFPLSMIIERAGFAELVCVFEANFSVVALKLLNWFSEVIESHTPELDRKTPIPPSKLIP